jgi:MFS family permease
LAAAIVLWALFSWRLAVAAEPLIPLGVLRNRVVAYGVIASSFTIGTFIGLTVAVPLYFEVVLGYSASLSGLAVIPLMIGTPFGATSAGRLMARVEHYKRLPLAGLAWSSAALFLIALSFDSLPAPALALVFAAVSVGFGTVLPVATVAVQNAVAPHEMGTATSINTFCRQMGGAFIVATFGAILVAGGAGTAVLQEGAPGTGAVADPALLEAFRLIFLVSAGGAALAFAMLLLMEERPLRDSG